MCSGIFSAIHPATQFSTLILFNPTFYEQRQNKKHTQPPQQEQAYVPTGQATLGILTSLLELHLRRP